MDRPLEKKEDEYLIEQKEEIVSKLTEGRGQSLDADIDGLLEIERELTLREE